MSSFLFLIPFIAAIAIIFGAPSRLTARAAAIATFLLGLYAAATWKNTGLWSYKFSALTIPSIDMAFGFINGTSAVMVALAVIVLLAAVFSGQSPEGREKLYYASSLLIGAGAIGAFVSTDLFFFYAFHELALIPTFLMIGLLGRGNRKEIAWKITIYLGVGSLILLAGLVWLAREAGTYNILTMLELQKAGTLIIAAETQKAIAALLIVGFGILVSLFPFHSWAAPAYASAPAPTAMLHAGVLKKFGLYGLLQLAVPLLPIGMNAWLTPLLVLLLGNILWVGLVTISQKRLDSMLGHSSVMHMGYIFLALAAVVAANAAGKSNEFGIPAATVLMFAHGISIAMLFGLTDRIENRTQSLDFSDLGGLAKPAPVLAFLFGIAGMASLGLPGLANFSGEVMVFLAGFEGRQAGAALGPVQIATILSLWGVVISAVYVLRGFRKTFHGSTVSATSSGSDLTLMEIIPAVLLALALLTVGIYPRILLQLLS
jgi:NADH-quinone oxidoreductase subunit M